MDPIDLESVVRHCGGSWASARPSGAERVLGFATDSRKVARGEVFVALEGEHADGHQFVGEAFRRGALASIVREARARGDLASIPSPLIAVAEPLEALERLAAWYRRSLVLEVTAITGSVGKTTVKEFLRVLLQRRFTVAAAPKSYNNRLGVALTLLAAGGATEQLVVEMGTSGPGEIAHLSRLVRPERVVITAIEAAHLSGLGDIEGVLAAKAEIFEGLVPGGTAYLRAGLPGFRRLEERAPRLSTFGWEGAGIAVTEVSPEVAGAGEGGYRFKIDGERLFLPVLGRHNLLNAAAAIAVARDLGISWDEIRAGLLDCRLPPQRLEATLWRGVLFLDDSYNANPASMRAAIDALDELPAPPGSRKVAVLGDMLELGGEARALHEEVGRRLAASRVELLVTVGAESGALAGVVRTERGGGAPAVEAAHFERREDAFAFLKERIGPGDQVLFKASRLIGVERIAADLRLWLESGGSAGKQTTCSRVSRN
jgi:UDP-N-acetylmuramoyl-tripeptide--D-alanyl-D-alanine ligase